MSPAIVVSAALGLACVLVLLECLGLATHDDVVAWPLVSVIVAARDEGAPCRRCAGPSASC